MKGQLLGMKMARNVSAVPMFACFIQQQCNIFLNYTTNGRRRRIHAMGKTTRQSMKFQVELQQVASEFFYKCSKKIIFQEG